MKKVHLVTSFHSHDRWTLERLTTWLVVEDEDGNDHDGDAGQILAEFRHLEHAEDCCHRLGWAITDR